MALTPDQQAYVAWSRKVYLDYLIYACSIVTPLGLILNSAMIYVFSRKRFHSSTMGFYYIVSSLRLFSAGMFYEYLVELTDSRNVRQLDAVHVFHRLVQYGYQTRLSRGLKHFVFTH